MIKVALDPYMLRSKPFDEVCRIAAEIVSRAASRGSRSVSAKLRRMR